MVSVAGTETCEAAAGSGGKNTDGPPGTANKAASPNAVSFGGAASWGGSSRDIGVTLGEVRHRQIVQIAPHFNRSNDSLPADFKWRETTSFEFAIDPSSAAPSNPANLRNEQILVSF